MSKPETVQQYIEQFSGPVRQRLLRLRDILQAEVPQADLVLKWGKPVLKTDRILFAFAAAKNHITFTPTGPALIPFASELEAFAITKDSVKFPHSSDLPETLIRRMAAWRVKAVQENDAKWRY